jgi:hypothetical protein
VICGPLTRLLRVGRSKADASALLGDIEEEYREWVRSGGGSRLRSRAWFVREVAIAAARGIGDRLRGREHDVDDLPRRRMAMSRVLDPSQVRQALRRWRRRPGVPVAIVLTLALGIGTTTAIFSVVDAVILRPWTWPEADRLAVVHAVFPERVNDPARAATWNSAPLTFPMWDALRQAAAFDDVAVWQPEPFPNTTFGEARTEIVSTTQVSSNLLPMLGARLLHGRHFNAEDDEKPTYTVILPYETWQRRFGGRPDIVGDVVPMGYASSGGRSPRKVIGVLAPGITFPGDAPEFFANLGIAAEGFRTYDGGNLRALARLKAAVALDRARVEAETVIGGLRRKEVTSVRLVPLTTEQLGSAARPLWFLFAGAGVLLLVACANIAGLLLSEAHARRHEFGVRAALGGRPVRAVRQLLVEHSVLAAAGVAAGLTLASC